MATIRSLVEERVRAALVSSQPGAPENAPIEIVRPPLAEHGDFYTNVAMQMARVLKKAPKQIADELVAALDAGPTDELLIKAEVAGPGFVNVWLTPGRVETLVDDIRANPKTYGAAQTPSPQKINVEFVSANPTGPLTVGNARGAFVGDLLCRVLEAAGNDVTREYYFNDSGRQVRVLGASVAARRAGEELPEEAYRGAYVDTLAAELPDEVWTAATR